MKSWIILALISFSAFGNEICSDDPAPLEDYIEGEHCTDLAEEVCGNGKGERPDPTGFSIRSDKKMRNEIEEKLPSYSNNSFLSHAEERLSVLQGILSDIISEQPLTNAQKTDIQNKVKDIKIVTTDCTKGRDGLDFLNSEYHSLYNCVAVCNTYGMIGTSDFALMSTLSHEISHSLGVREIVSPYILDRPKNDQECRENRKVVYVKDLHHAMKETKATTVGALLGQHPFAKALECLRDQETAHALAPQTKTPYQELSSSFLSADQIDEVYADWLGAEILSRYFETKNFSSREMRIGYSNILRGFCSIKKIDNRYLPIKERINRIWMMNPRIRKQMGCSTSHSKFKYCALNGVKI